MPGRDEAVAAVVARAAKHEDRLLAVAVGGGARDRLARRLHQRRTGDARGDGSGICRGHLRTGQERKLGSGEERVSHCERAIGAADRT